jgi:hypothetical protein
MSSLSFFYITQCCAHEGRSKNIQNEVLACAKAQFSSESQRNLQNLCANVYVMWRKA